MIGKLKELGYDSATFELHMHSFRADGAIAAAAAQVPDCLFKRHRRWRSENAKDGYVQDPEAVQLGVSKNLKL